MRVTWHGWIKAKPEQREELEKLGVRGRMQYNPAHDPGIFEHCEADEETMERLIENWPDFWPGCFTGVRWDGKQLPPAQQKFWKLGQQDRYWPAKG